MVSCQLFAWSPVAITGNWAKFPKLWPNRGNHPNKTKRLVEGYSFNKSLPNGQNLSAFGGFVHAPLELVLYPTGSFFKLSQPLAQASGQFGDFFGPKQQQDHKNDE
jgi:hypothetical protein